MNRYVVMVDAGYLLASMARVLTGSSNRNMIQVNWEKLVQQMKQEVESLQLAQSQGSELLRVQWYDSPPEDFDGKRMAEESFLAIDGISRTKTRIGRTSFGNQKGVDVKLALDIVNLSMRGLVTDLYLVSGDDDLTEAVELAQDYGVRVHLYNVGALEDSPIKAKFGLYSTATNLARRADERHTISPDLIRRAANIVPQVLPGDHDGGDRVEAAARIAAAAAGLPTAAADTEAQEAVEEAVQAVAEDKPLSPAARMAAVAQAAAARKATEAQAAASSSEKTEAEKTESEKTASKEADKPAATPAAAKKPAAAPAPAPAAPKVITPKVVPFKKMDIGFRPPAEGTSFADYERQTSEILRESIRTVVKQTVDSLVKVGRVESLLRRYARPHIPSDIDRGLLIDVCQVMGEPDMDIASWEREHMRAVFWDELERYAPAED